MWSVIGIPFGRFGSRPSWQKNIALAARLALWKLRLWMSRVQRSRRCMILLKRQLLNFRSMSSSSSIEPFSSLLANDPSRHIISGCCWGCSSPPLAVAVAVVISSWSRYLAQALAVIGDKDQLSVFNTTSSICRISSSEHAPSVT